MRIVNPVFELIDWNNVMRNIELGIRKCYKSEDKMGPGSDVAIIGKILTPKNGIKHESVLEHGVITAGFLMDRGVSHEIVRHRHISPSQESTRYCNYQKDKYGNEITVVNPCFFDPLEEGKMLIMPVPDTDDNGMFSLRPGTDAFVVNPFDVWLLSCLWAEWGYLTLTEVFKRSAQEARSVLPNSLKTEIQITANVREWRHILLLRTGRDAHPQMRQIMVPLAHVLAAKWPALFGEFADVQHPSPALHFVAQPDDTGGADELPSGGSTEESRSESDNQNTGLRPGTSPVSESESPSLPGGSVLQE